MRVVRRNLDRFPKYNENIGNLAVINALSIVWSKYINGGFRLIDIYYVLIIVN